MDKSQAIRSSSPSPQVIVKAAHDEERQPFWSKNIKDERKETVKGMLSGLLLITGACERLREVEVGPGTDGPDSPNSDLQSYYG
jgi:hypothetical protein